MPLIKSLKISWLSPQRINQLSFGAITSHKVVNIRTFKPELGGLFDPRIFGPFLNYECYCGKYKGRQNKGKECDRCEVLITEKNIQRWRMGHIELSCPVTNIIFFKTLATNLSKILEIPVKTLEDIIYFRAYIVIDNGSTNLIKKRQILEKKIDFFLISEILKEVIANNESSEKAISEAKKLNKSLLAKGKQGSAINNIFLEDYLEFFEKYQKIKIWTGTEAFKELISQVNINEELKKLQSTNEKKAQKVNQEKIKFLKALQKSGINLEWMIIKNLLVIPCGLRPIIKLKDDNTIVASQINNLYHRIILIDKLLANYYLDNKKSQKIVFNEIIYNEKKRLQKAVDQLLIGLQNNKKNEVKSLLQNLSGKEGILRRYSLGKRVDYSARSVIVPNPNLLLDQIGLPVRMILTLYKPFIIRKILKDKIAFTIKEAEQLLLNEDPVVFSFLNEIIQNHPVLANRAPSLHRLSIQGFYPKLTLNNSIELHPLITTALNADFDGDQIAIYLPLSEKAREEVKSRVLSPLHIIDSKNGYLIDVPNQDMILGIYYLTKVNKSKERFYYDEISSIQKSYDQGKINLYDLIVIPAVLAGRNFATAKNKFIFTTFGKLIFNQILPPNFPFYLSDLKKFNEGNCEQDEILIKVNEIEEEWKNCQPSSGWKKKEIISFLNKLVRLTPREEMVNFLDRLKKLGFDYATYSGISISPFELGEIVSKKKELDQAEKSIKEINDYYLQGFYGEEELRKKKILVWENCKDNLQNQLITNLAGKNSTSFYHIWDSGARASSESLTQIFAMRGNTTNYLGDIIDTPIISSLWEGLTPFEFFISVYGAVKGMIDIALKTAIAGDLTRRLVESSQILSIISSDCQTDTGILLEANEDLTLTKRIYGRYLARDIFSEKNIILVRNTLILEKEVQIIQEHKITEAWVRSPLNCELVDGICQKCYGSDLSKLGETISMGTAVGIIAAQSLGEPGTQLTMRTFHSGGIAEGEDIIQGLPKIREIFDNIKPKKEEKTFLAKENGKIIVIEEKMIKQKTQEGEEIVYSLGSNKIIVLKGDLVEKGEKLTVGKVDLEEYLEIMGRDACQIYIKNEVRKVYSNQGIDINEKHIEIFARQMLSKVKIIDDGDSDYLVGDIVNYQQIQKINKSLLIKKKQPIYFKNIISSLKDLASLPSSFLAGISFQNTLKSLVNYSLYQPVDYLKGSKESLIAGQLVPVGTGFVEREKHSKSSTSSQVRN